MSLEEFVFAEGNTQMSAFWWGDRRWRFGVTSMLAVCCAAAQVPARMPAEAHPEFEVAAIKPSDPASTRQGINGDAHGMNLLGQTVTSMMMFAYGIHKTQIVDGPGWRSTDKFDIAGTSTVPGEPDLKQMQEMLRKLLAERFDLKVHEARREMSYYGIEMSRGGSKMARAAVQDGTPDQTGNGNKGVMEMRFTSNTMLEFALGMQYFLDRPVVDESGLSGRYDFTLRWTPSDATPSEPNPPPGLFTAMQEQLGLKAEVKKGLVDVVVIDGLARPSGN